MPLFFRSRRPIRSNLSVLSIQSIGAIIRSNLPVLSIQSIGTIIKSGVQIKNTFLIFKWPKFQKAEKHNQPKKALRRKLIRSKVWPKKECSLKTSRTPFSAIFSNFKNNFLIRLSEPFGLLSLVWKFCFYFLAFCDFGLFSYSLQYQARFEIL